MDGVLVLDKPGGITSRKAVDEVAEVAGALKAGHTGTLDPLATGVLTVCLDRATLLAGVLSGGIKEYEVEAVLGVETDTYDTDGTPTGGSEPGGVRVADVQECLEELRGPIEQVPPAFSAVKHGGRPLYKYAREGTTVQPVPRRVYVESIELSSLDRSGSRPTVRLRVACGPGTYVRSLVFALGRSLGCGATVSSLRRTRTGAFVIEQASPLSELTGRREVSSRLLSMEEATDALPTVTVDKEIALAVQFGKKLQPESASGSDFEPCEAPHTFRVVDGEGALLALYGPPESDSDMGCYRARRVLRPADCGVA